ncbi:DUF2512 family protein [Bacillus suaedaesalsae]|uniref:DUF2512 family protein n=1 Tax=Bacillus suaedaesalsae TaxID=2810349 RepID=A0ABS2DHH5_9BACI|nr:DUF2512 family protein [Bacillus suaedaesalsae]MBM6617932.1 DUF2512 family protein [Bacillus suaedaesalsae]
MKMMKVLAIKFVTCIIAFAIGLDLFFDATFAHILSFSIFLTLASYVVGERVILPLLGKRAANVADFLLAYLTVWIFGSVLLESYLQIAWGSIISAIIITTAEVILHLMVGSRAGERDRNPIFTRPLATLATEFAEEFDTKGLNGSKYKKE